jgi:uncharacterized protein
MVMDWSAFTPNTAFAGGALIGTAAGLLILLNGRIAGISGIVGGLLKPSRGEIAWRTAFILGLVMAPVAYSLAWPLPPVQIEANEGLLVIAGLLVGLGTRYATGCTSGHGVCGLSRLSLRSLAATVNFMAAGFATVFVVRHLLVN